MVTKVDLEKAYDKLDWRVIEESLTDISFNASLRINIIDCITSPRLAINWNGQTSNYIYPEEVN